MPQFSIKTKLSAVIGILVMAAGLFNLGVLPSVARSQFRAQAVQSMGLLAGNAALSLAPPLGSDDAEGVAHLLQGLETAPEFSFYAVYQASGQRLASRGVVPPWVLPGAGGEVRAFIREGDDILVAVAPIFLRNGGRGSLVLGFTTQGIRRAVWSNIWRSAGTGFLAGGVAMLLGLVLAQHLIRPLERLTEAVREVGSGNFQGRALGGKSQDELGVLSRSFDAMTSRLKVSQEEIGLQNKLLESRVQERTGQLLETIWELEETRADLEKVVQMRTRGLEQSRAELEAWAGTLEEKVREKTQELTEANDYLLVSLQKLQEVDRIKSEFLANMSHELRTPLNAVIGFSGLLMQEREDRIPPDVKGELGIIHQNGRNLLGMIDSILDLSKIEAGKFELDLAPLDPYPLLDEVKGLTVGLIGGRPIRFDLEIPAREGRILGDPARFKQVIMNLVANAIKFTEEGEVAMRAEASGERLRIAIRDTGIGMSEGEMERLFKPFQQVDGSITRRFGGTGLGLALSQRLARAMAGRITVTSTKGKGSTFVVDLPLLPEGAP